MLTSTEWHDESSKHFQQSMAGMVYRRGEASRKSPACPMPKRSVITDLLGQKSLHRVVFVLALF